jgi:hypothetical protein
MEKHFLSGHDFSNKTDPLNSRELKKKNTAVNSTSELPSECPAKFSRH